MALLNFDDVCLIPAYSEVKSRSDCNTYVAFNDNYLFSLPVILANMRSIINENLCIYLATNGLFYINHRFDVDNLIFCKKMKSIGLYTSISTGVKDESYADLLNLYQNNVIPDFITLDIAHSHSHSAESMLHFLKSTFPSSYIIAGNVCTVEGALFLAENGANAIKIGVGAGSVCSTKLETGFTYPQFSAVKEISDEFKKNVSYKNILLISDGGIKYFGDIAKAIVAGADMVMTGGLFASCKEVGEKANCNKNYNEYYGSASARNKGNNKNVEGVFKKIEIDSSVEEKLKHLKESLQSSISYAGGNKLSDLKNCNWVSLK